MARFIKNNNGVARQNRLIDNSAAVTTPKFGEASSDNRVGNTTDLIAGILRLVASGETESGFRRDEFVAGFNAFTAEDLNSAVIDCTHTTPFWLGFVAARFDEAYYGVTSAYHLNERPVHKMFKEILGEGK